jgi:hypothetical protein
MLRWYSIEERKGHKVVTQSDEIRRILFLCYCVRKYTWTSRGADWQGDTLRLPCCQRWGVVGAIVGLFMLPLPHVVLLGLVVALSAEHQHRRTARGIDTRHMLLSPAPPLPHTVEPHDVGSLQELCNPRNSQKSHPLECPADRSASAPWSCCMKHIERRS